MELVLRSNEKTYGEVGKPTGIKLDDIDVCIGDKVYVRGYKACIDKAGIVVKTSRGITITGFGHTPIAEIKVTKILERGADLKEGSVLSGEWTLTVEREEEHQEREETTALAITEDDDLYGVVGLRTTQVCNGTPLCIGDVVKFISKLGKEVVGPIVMAGFVVYITDDYTGLNCIEDIEIVEIIKSHKELKAGDEIEGEHFCFVIQSVTGLRQI